MRGGRRFLGRGGLVLIERDGGGHLNLCVETINPACILIMLFCLCLFLWGGPPL